MRPVTILTALITATTFLPVAGLSRSLSDARKVSIQGVGDAQGLALREGHIYIYGDLETKGVHKGIIKELDLNLKPTGRLVFLEKDKKAVITHPTGLTWSKRWKTFMGDTVNGEGRIYQLDWKRMWKDGNLDNAILTEIVDDASRGGVRPEFVSYRGRTYLATADYTDKNPEIRLYDPAIMMKRKRTTKGGAIAFRASAGPFNQNLCFDQKTGRLICVQNLSPGKGWCLDIINLDKLFEDGLTKARIKRIVLEETSELEGFRLFKKNQALFVTSHPEDNLRLFEGFNELY